MKLSCLGVFAKLLKATISFIISVWLSNSVHGKLGCHWFSIKTDVWVFFEQPLAKIQVSLKPDILTVHEDQCMFLIISRW